MPESGTIGTPEKRLAAMNYDLVHFGATPMGSYVPAVNAGGLVFLSGHPPMRDGKIRFQGKVGSEISLEDGREAARLAAVNAVASLRHEARSLNNVARIVKMLAFVNCGPDFRDHPKVVDAASDLLAEVFGDAGLHSRAAVGAPALPSNIAVEIEMVAMLRDEIT